MGTNTIAFGSANTLFNQASIKSSVVYDSGNQKIICFYTEMENNSWIEEYRLRL